VLREKPSAGVDERIRHAFELCVARSPAESELKTLRDLYEAQLKASRQEPAAAEQLVGKFSKPEGVSMAEFAAWYSVATALLNLDETITKG
jgi:hypothetical protein